MIDHLSYSSVNSYLLCPAAWKFRYLDKTPAPTSPNLVFGSAFHDTIGSFLTRKTSTPLEAIWLESWQAQLENERNKNINWSDTTADDMQALGERMFQSKKIAQTVEALKPLILNDEQVIEKFIQLSVPGVSVPVIGYIDIITQDGVPCDFKTAGKKWYPKKAQDETQPIFYLAALNQEGYNLNPDLKFRHYIFTKTKTPAVQVFETTRTVGEMINLFSTVTQVWKGIESEVFPCNQSTWKCSEKWCEYWPICRGATR